MSRFSCTCPIPRQIVDPRRPETCQACLGWINPDWTSNDRTVSKFYDRLAASLFIPDQMTGKLLVPDDYIVFRAEAEARERAGRETFGHRSLARNNLRDAREEAADGGNYLLFHHLRKVREGDGEDRMARVLTGASHFFKAHQIARELSR